MSNTVAGIQATVLRWARESQGYSIEDVARRLKRAPAEIASWEAGTASPTYSQLETLAYKLYKRPLAVFFLPEPPQEPAPKQEFRTLPEADLDRLLPDTRLKLRLARSFQLGLKELTDNANPAVHKIFRDIPVSPQADVHREALGIRSYLGVTLALQVSWSSNDEALREWRSRIEEAGVFVFKGAFKQRDISAFSLTDEEFPVIYVNNGTRKTRQIFSLFHELAHLLLHDSSITKLDESYIDRLPRHERDLERFCNALAAEVLIPSHDFTEQVRSLNRVDDDLVEGLAERYQVSREVVLRRMLDRGMVQPSYYEAKAQEWMADSRETESGGGNYYATQATYLGEHYLRLVFSKHYQGKLSLEQVADYLGVKIGSVAGLEAAVLGKPAPA